MRPIIGLYCLALSLLGCGAGERFSGSPLHSMNASAEGNGLSVVVDDMNGVYVSGQAAGLQLDRVTLSGQEFERASLLGFNGVTEPGFPEVPFTLLQVAVPNGMQLVLAQTVTGAPKIYTLASELAYQDVNPSHAFSLHGVEQNRLAYRENYGERLAEVLDVSYAGSVKLATIKFMPVRYEAQSRQLQVTERFEVEIIFQPEEAAWTDPPVGGIPQGAAISVVANPRLLQSDFATNTKVDLVIAHTSLREALAPYIAFKRATMGREVREHYITEMTAQEIKEIIAAEYRVDSPPTQTLLVGNIEHIPSWRGTGDNTWTDFPYSTLDSGSVPDISLGRVPAHDETELSAFVDKAMDRELADRNVEDVLLTAGRDTRLGCPTNVIRVGQKFATSNNAVNEIRQLRSNGASTSDVIAAYNESPNLIVYDGHGDRYGMQEIPLLMSNLDRLENSSYSIILDIACLNASWRGGAYQRNFAESILLMRGAGAAGLLASGGSGYGHDFFQSIAEIMAAGRRDMLDNQETLMNEIGQTILAAKIRHGAQDRSFWNYYGDPASSVWESPTHTYR